MAEIMTQRKNKQKLCVKENKETFPRKEIVETHNGPDQGGKGK